MISNLIFSSIISAFYNKYIYCIPNIINNLHAILYT